PEINIRYVFFHNLSQQKQRKGRFRNTLNHQQFPYYDTGYRNTMKKKKEKNACMKREKTLTFGTFREYADHNQ
ncbi:hypothetical protein, partial [Mailhella massiliensis]